MTSSMAKKPPAPTVLNAIEFNDPRFDQPANPIRTKLVVCSTQRSGSFLLGRAMIHHGLGVPHEYFNPRHMGELGPRFGVAGLDKPERFAWDPALRRAYIDAIRQNRTVDGVFAAKVQWWQFREYLDNDEGQAFLANARFIHLYREDLLGQAISLWLSLLSGRWGLDERVTSPPINRDPRNYEAIERLMDDVAEADQNWRAMFARRRVAPVTISYERLIASPAGAVRQIAGAYDIPLRPVADYAEARVEAPPRGPGPSAAELREWFEAQPRRNFAFRPSRDW